MVLNNIQVVNKGTYYQITGDVNNAGLEDAKSIIVTTARATPVAPMETYVVGSLEPDGLAGFDVTFANPESNTVDLMVNYKNSDGNPYQSTAQVTLNSVIVSGNATSANDGSPVGVFRSGRGNSSDRCLCSCCMAARTAEVSEEKINHVGRSRS